MKIQEALLKGDKFLLPHKSGIISKELIVDILNKLWFTYADVISVNDLFRDDWEIKEEKIELTWMRILEVCRQTPDHEVRKRLLGFKE